MGWLELTSAQQQMIKIIAYTKDRIQVKTREKQQGQNERPITISAKFHATNHCARKKSKTATKQNDVTRLVDNMQLHIKLALL